jgi:phytoene/squalene synthetase
VLDDLYRRRALPAGSGRYLCWLFAPAASRDAWFGIFALQAEWRALLHPATDPGVRAAKLDWWREELLRLMQGRGVHPICRFLEQLPGAADTDLQALRVALDAVAVQSSGVPVERRADLDAHADALYGGPLRVAASLGAAPARPARGGFDPVRHEPALRACTAAAALGEYLGGALADHRGDARRGLIAFPVDDLLAAGIETAELAAVEVSPRLRHYLDRHAREALAAFERAAHALPPEARPALRGLLVLIDLERRQLKARELGSRPAAGATPAEDDARFANLWWAWCTARRATHAHSRRNRGADR